MSNNKVMEWGEEPELSGPRDYFRISLLASELKKYGHGKTLLDFGCGSGHLLMQINSLGYNCVGMDASESAINYLSCKVQDQNLANITCIKGTDQDLAKLNRSFDVIISGETIEHIENDQRLLQIWSDKLNQNGVCIFSTPAHQYLWDLNDGFSSHFRRYELKELTEKCQKAGLKVVNGFYWGWPLAQLWHTHVYNRMMQNKISKGANYSEKSHISFLTRNRAITRILSLPFYFDNLFNWTKKGGGLIITAQKA